MLHFSVYCVYVYEICMGNLGKFGIRSVCLVFSWWTYKKAQCRTVFMPVGFLTSFKRSEPFFPLNHTQNTFKAIRKILGLMQNCYFKCTDIKKNVQKIWKYMQNFLVIRIQPKLVECNTHPDPDSCDQWQSAGLSLKFFWFSFSFFLEQLLLNKQSTKRFLIKEHLSTGYFWCKD